MDTTLKIDAECQSTEGIHSLDKTTQLIATARVFTGAACGRSDDAGSGRAVTWYEPEVGREALCLEPVVGDEVDEESVGG